MNFALLAWGDAGWGDELAWGALVTLAIAAAAFLLGTVFGSLGAAAKLSRNRALRWLAEAYTTVLRGVPELLVIYLVFFGGTELAGTIASRLFGFTGVIDLPTFGIGVLCLGLTSGAYATEVIRGAVQAVPKGQLEAATAIGMRRGMRLRRVLIPLAARYALPGLGNIWQLTLKDTSLVSVVGLVELMRTAALAAGSTRQPFTFYLAAGVLFLLLTAISAQAFRAAELRAERGVRR